MLNYAKENTMKNQLIRLLAMVLALLTIFSSCAFADSFSAIVDVNKMTVYANYDRIGRLGTLKRNTIITVLEAQDNVAKFTYKGRVGYASIDDLVSVAEIAETVTVQKNSRVYLTASKAAKSAKIAAGTEVNLLDKQGKWSAIERDGYLGFIPTSALQITDTATQPEGNDIVTCNEEAQVAVSKLVVYASASTGAKKLGTMKKGTVVTVLAYNNTWAYIDLDGHRGHVKHAGLEKVEAKPTPTPVPTPTPTPTPKPTPTPAPDYNSNSKYTNEEIIFAFLTRECGFNTAAACGVLANIKAESGFRPTALNSIGCYGICQWYKGRRTRLNNFCEENGYDSASLEGQLWYLKYELQNHYKGTWNYLKGVDNTSDGAYDAAYYWCYYFEIPENRTSNSIKRGNSAQDTYWPKYAK